MENIKAGEHTQGEFLKEKSSNGYFITDKEGQVLAIVDERDMVNISEAEPNANLFKSAPKMLEALEKCMPYMHDLQKDNYDDVNNGIREDYDLKLAFEALESAIKSAKGE